MADTFLERLDERRRREANALVRSTIARFLEAMAREAGPATTRQRAKQLGLRILDGGRKS